MFINLSSTGKLLLYLGSSVCSTGTDLRTTVQRKLKSDFDNINDRSTLGRQPRNLHVDFIIYHSPLQVWDTPLLQIAKRNISLLIWSLSWGGLWSIMGFIYFCVWLCQPLAPSTIVCMSHLVTEEAMLCFISSICDFFPRHSVNSVIDTRWN